MNSQIFVKYLQAGRRGDLLFFVLFHFFHRYSEEAIEVIQMKPLNADGIYSGIIERFTVQSQFHDLFFGIRIRYEETFTELVKLRFIQISVISQQDV